MGVPIEIPRMIMENTVLGRRQAEIPSRPQHPRAFPKKKEGGRHVLQGLHQQNHVCDFLLERKMMPVGQNIDTTTWPDLNRNPFSFPQIPKLIRFKAGAKV